MKLNMKKMYNLLIIIFVFLAFPLHIKASQYGIEQFYMHVTVLESGDLYVREAFSMNDTYNGFERDINFRNSNAHVFTGDKNSFRGSDIYNGTDIELIQVRGIPFGSYNSWADMSTGGTLFKESTYGSNGNYGIYTINNRLDGQSYKIYNPSNKKNMFYLEYIIKNMAIEHIDVAEIGWNIFNSGLRESIHHLKVDIYLPYHNTTLRGWAHGPLIGNIKLDGNHHIEITIDNLPAHTAIDTRFVFDKDVVSCEKTTQVNALDKIIEVETELADTANREREEARKQLEAEQKQKEKRMLFFGIISMMWGIGLLILVPHIYRKHDKERTSTFKTKYFRDFPANYNPSTVGYLFHQNISNNDLSACLLNLIYKKIVTFEKVGKKDYQLTYHENEVVMTESDKKLIKLIFNEPEITLSKLKRRARSGYESFINDFNEWKMEATKEAKNEHFFETKTKIKIFASIYAIIGMIISLFLFESSVKMGVIVFITGIASLFYFLLFSKRTIKGNEDYLRWKALKNFMEDFGRMDKKELPEIVLWEKYLVYAVSLGCADKLSEEMKLRITEFNDTEMINILMFSDLTHFNSIVSSSITSALNNAYSAQSIANSSNSSGGGYGGGFSSGGGSFGGGSGGGRF